MRDRIPECIKTVCAAILLMAARYVTVGLAGKDLVLYAVFFFLYAVYTLWINDIVYGVLCVLCGAGVTIFFGIKTTVLCLPVLLFLALTARKENTSGKNRLKRTKTTQLLYMAALEPVLFIVFALVTKPRLSEIAQRLDADKIVLFSCFALFTTILLYSFRLKSLSGKKHDRNKDAHKAFQYSFLLITYLESVLLGFVTQASYYHVILLSDLWLGLVFVEYISRKKAEKRGARD